MSPTYNAIIINILDAKIPETVNESGDNQWKSKNVRFQSASKTVSQEMSAPTAAANTEVEKALDVNTEVKAVQPQIPEPFVGTVVHAESINCFFVHRTSNDALYDEECILVFINFIFYARY